MGTGILLLGASIVANVFGAKLLPGRAKALAPAIGWMVVQVLLSRGPVVWYVTSFCIQAVFGGLTAMAYGMSNDAATRIAIFPLVATAAAYSLGRLVGPSSTWCILGVVAVQLWSAVGGLAMLACYPASVIQLVEGQQTRNLRFKRAARILIHKKDKDVETCSVRVPGTGVDVQVTLIKQSYRTSRWVMYLGGNAEFSENTMSDVTLLGDGLRANVILFNPRGIGLSTGYVSQVSDLVEDAAAVAVQMMVQERIAPEQLLLFGHSIGGAVAAMVAQRVCPQSPIVVDRTFSALSDAAVEFSFLTPRATRRVLPLLIGDLRTIDAWNGLSHKRKLVLFAKKDEIIKYETASIARLPQFEEDACCVELQGTPSSHHNSLLSEFENKNAVFSKMDELFPLMEKGGDAAGGTAPGSSDEEDEEEDETAKDNASIPKPTKTEKQD